MRPSASTESEEHESAGLRPAAVPARPPRRPEGHRRARCPAASSTARSAPRSTRCPRSAVRALVDAASRRHRLPGDHRQRRRTGRPRPAWIARRFGCTVTRDEVVACIGTKELVASLPAGAVAARPVARHRALPRGVVPHLRDGRDRSPGSARCRCRVDDRVAPRPRRASTAADADRALVLWLNDPSNPTGVTATPDEMRGVGGLGARARDHRGERRVLRRVHLRRRRRARPTPVTALTAGLDGVLAVHSLSKRSNMAGLRAGFVAGDRDLVTYLGEVRKHGGLMTPAPVQAAAAAALGDDEHVREQQARYARRRARRARRARGARPRARRRAVDLLPLAAHRERPERRLGDRRRPRQDRPARRARRLLRCRRRRATPGSRSPLTDDAARARVRAPRARP